MFLIKSGLPGTQTLAGSISVTSSMSEYIGGSFVITAAVLWAEAAW